MQKSAHVAIIDKPTVIYIFVLDRFYYARDSSPLASFEKIFQCASDEVYLRQALFGLQVLAGSKTNTYRLYKKQCSKWSPCPSTILSRLFSNFFVMAFISQFAIETIILGYTSTQQLIDLS